MKDELSPAAARHREPCRLMLLGAALQVTNAFGGAFLDDFHRRGE